MTALTDLTHDYPRLRATIEALANWFHRHEQIRQVRHDFEAAGPEEVAHIAHDLGISPYELVRVAEKGPGAAALLLKRLAALHLKAEDIATFQPALMQDLQRLCSLCTAHGRCQRDLRRNPDDPVWKGYCPNAQTLEALQDQA